MLALSFSSLFPFGATGWCWPSKLFRYRRCLAGQKPTLHWLRFTLHDHRSTVLQVEGWVMVHRIAQQPSAMKQNKMYQNRLISLNFHIKENSATFSRNAVFLQIFLNYQLAGKHQMGNCVTNTLTHSVQGMGSSPSM